MAADLEALVRLARWGVSLVRRDTRRPSPLPDNPRFASARDAVARIRDGSVVAVSGLGAQQRASVVYRALREVYAETGHPRRLTLVNIGGQGSRGLLPGSLDELALPGLCTRFITSHFETFHGFLALAEAGRCELQCLPLGVIALLYDALARGEDSVVSDTGVGTFIDPRVGRGSPVQRGRREQLVTVEGDRLRYRMPPIDVAIFNLPAADRRGSLYAKYCVQVGDSAEIARAAKRSGGLVIANVGRLVREGWDRVFLPARSVDAIVFDPDTEQTPGYFHRAPWSAVTTRSRVSIGRALQHVRAATWLAAAGGGIKARSAVDAAVVRLAAATLAAEVPKGSSIAIGTGLAEEVPRAVFESGRLGDVTFLVESGCVGGLPARGAYFGAAFSPKEIVSTAEIFRRCRRRLDAACLGALEVDGRGDVNVSQRGRGVRHCVGPGGFMDFAAAARTIVIVCGWMRGGKMAVEGETVRILERGRPKFVPRVAEVTFSAARALATGKRILYVTPVGVFRRTARGLALERAMPGIDVRGDVLGVTPIEVGLPPGEVPRVPGPIVSGEGFRLPAWGSGRGAKRARRPASGWQRASAPPAAGT